MSFFFLPARYQLQKRCFPLVMIHARHDARHYLQRKTNGLCRVRILLFGFWCVPQTVRQREKGLFSMVANLHRPSVDTSDHAIFDSQILIYKYRHIEWIELNGAKHLYLIAKLFQCQKPNSKSSFCYIYPWNCLPSVNGVWRIKIACLCLLNV